MRVFGHLPFKWKLTLILMATSVFSLLVGSLAFAWYDNYLFRDAMIKELQATASNTAEVIGALSDASMTAGNREAVDKALSSLKDKDQPLIVAAAVYTTGDAVISSYTKTGSGETIPPRPLKSQTSLEGDHLTVFRPINSSTVIPGSTRRVLTSRIIKCRITDSAGVRRNSPLSAAEPEPQPQSGSGPAEGGKKGT